MRKKPPIYPVPNKSGTVSHQVDLGIIDGIRVRRKFTTRVEAETFAEQARITKENEGTSALLLPPDVRMDATKANAILAPHGYTILESAKYFQKHFLAYKTAPLIKEIVQKYIDDAPAKNNRPRTIQDKEDRLGKFSEDFGDCRLSDLKMEDIKEWVEDDAWSMRTRINYLTKLSQLYGFAVRRKWVDSNITEQIERPTVDETTPEIYTVDEAKRLLTNSGDFDLLPYISIGLFGGVRSAEMLRLQGTAINFEHKTITISALIAKKRSQRNIEMQPVLLDWLEPFKDKFKAGGPIVDAGKFRTNKEKLLEAAGIETWKSNGLRHSFGSYHYAQFKQDNDTAYQMGNSADVVHKHYKTLVNPSDAAKFWNLFPDRAEKKILEFSASAA